VPFDVRTVTRDGDRQKYETREAWIFVDGRPLVELVAEAERPFQTTEGAGDYVYPPPDVALAPSRHLLGEPAEGEWDEESVRGKIAIGGCSCGVVGC
jgi:hypothetical protein